MECELESTCKSSVRGARWGGCLDKVIKEDDILI